MTAVGPPEVDDDEAEEDLQVLVLGPLAVTAPGLLAVGLLRRRLLLVFVGASSSASA